MKFMITKMSGINSESEQEYLIDYHALTGSIYMYLTMIWFMMAYIPTVKQITASHEQFIQ